MNKALKSLIILIAVLIVIFTALLIAHEVVENKIFKTLAQQSGGSLQIGTRKGNLLSGYDLSYLEIRQQSGAEITLPRVSIQWKLFPFRVTELSWESSTVRIGQGDGSPEEFTFDAGSLFPDGRGWLVADDRIKIGPESWRGFMEIKIRTNVSEVDGEIEIQKFPGRLAKLFGDIPDWFDMPGTVRVEMTLTGPLTNPEIDGHLKDTFTGEEYPF